MSRGLVRDCFAGLGLSLVSVGCWWAWPPAGLIVPGFLLMVAALWSQFRGPT